MSVHNPHTIVLNEIETKGETFDDCRVSCVVLAVKACLVLLNFSLELLARANETLLAGANETSCSFLLRSGSLTNNC